MRPISVIGLGAMGSALASTLLKAGHPVTVWNRSAAKATPLIARGATLAPSVSEAIAAGDITLICVDNYAVSQQLLDEPGWDAYGASKGALVALTQSLANSLAEYTITVNAISPGWIQTEDYPPLTEADHRQHPSGRVGRPDDITRACLFLADPRNDFINGANLVVDGGMSKKMIYHTSASFWES